MLCRALSPLHNLFPPSAAHSVYIMELKFEMSHIEREHVFLDFKKKFFLNISDLLKFLF